MALATTQQDIVSLLTADHQEVRTLLKRLQDAKGNQAKSLFQQIRQELDIHTKVEEEIVYPEYRKCVGNKDAKVLVQESLTEHNLVDRVLSEMEGLQPSSVEWQGKATVLKELVEHHAKDEEKEMFPKFRQECSQQKLAQLAQRVEQRKKELKDKGSRRSGTSRSAASGRSGSSRGRASTSSEPTKQQLYQQAKKAGIEGRSQMDKDELMRALKRR